MHYNTFRFFGRDLSISYMRISSTGVTLDNESKVNASQQNLVIISNLMKLCTLVVYKLEVLIAHI